MKKKEYTKPETKVVHITPCAILVASEIIPQGFVDEDNYDNDNVPAIKDGWAIAD